MAESDDIATSAAKPKRTTVDGTTTERRDLSDELEGRRAAAADKGVAKKHRGLRFNKLNPPGSI